MKKRVHFAKSPMSNEQLETIRNTLASNASSAQALLDDLLTLCDESISSLSQCHERILQLQLPHHVYDQQISSLRGPVTEQMSTWAQWLMDVRKIAADEIRGESTSPLPIPPEPKPIDIAQYNETLNRYKANIDNLAAVKSRALREMEYRILIEYTEINAAQDMERKRIQRAIDSTSRSLKRLNSELARLQEMLTDTTEAAKSMTSSLAAGIGMHGFSIEPNQDKTAYSIIRRNGSQATHLSEGERNIVSLLYFLHSLKDAALEDRDLIVFIDDPGAALDLENTAAILEMLRSESRNWHQTFISMHSMFVLKQAQKVWDTFVNDLDSSNENSSVACFETTLLRHDEGGNPIWGLQDASPALVKFNSDYEYAYWMTLKAAAGEIDAELLPGIANTARRALEGLLAFRYPGAKNVRAGLDQAWSKVDPENRTSELKVAAMSFMNRVSHKSDNPSGTNAWTNVTKEDFNRAVAIMAIIDREHHEQMLKSIDWGENVDLKKYQRLGSKYTGIFSQAMKRPDFDANRVLSSLP